MIRLGPLRLKPWQSSPGGTRPSRSEPTWGSGAGDPGKHLTHLGRVLPSALPGLLGWGPHHVSGNLGGDPHQPQPHPSGSVRLHRILLGHAGAGPWDRRRTALQGRACGEGRCQGNGGTEGAELRDRSLAKRATRYVCDGSAPVYLRAPKYQAHMSMATMRAPVRLRRRRVLGRSQILG